MTHPASSFIAALIAELNQRQEIATALHQLERDPHMLEDIGLEYDDLVALEWTKHRETSPLRAYLGRLRVGPRDKARGTRIHGLGPLDLLNGRAARG